MPSPLWSYSSFCLSLSWNYLMGDLSYSWDPWLSRKTKTIFSWSLFSLVGPKVLHLFKMIETISWMLNILDVFLYVFPKSNNISKVVLGTLAESPSQHGPACSGGYVECKWRVLFPSTILFYFILFEGWKWSFKGFPHAFLLKQVHMLNNEWNVI